MKAALQEVDIAFHDFHPPEDDFYAEVIEGLKGSPPTISPKFFYDQQGSRLFDAICACHEYYPTRTESKILRDRREAIAQHVGEGCVLIEPGAGSTEKVRLLLDALRPRTFIPMDISREHLRLAAQGLAEDYPWLDVCAACVDFTAPIPLPVDPDGARKVVFFPGSSIGNFEPQAAEDFLAQLRDMVGEQGGLIIGVDLKKDAEVLHAAYNDRLGITAAFNLNLLHRINRELAADFDVTAFAHHAFYNDELGRVEMHLRCQRDTDVRIGGETLRFARDSSIHTENSYKYHVEEFQQLAARAGFRPRDCWTDEDGLFSVHYFEAA